MKSFAVLSLLPHILAASVAAFPATGQQTPLGELSSGAFVGNLFGQLTHTVEHAIHDVFDSKPKQELEKWIENGKELIQKGGIIYELVTHPAFESYQLRVTEPTLCERGVKQYSGYLDIAEDKHLFFWFFEARNSPEEAPLVLWMNGGPGCSSSTGLLFELGPCRIDDEGAGVTSNPHSWTNVANVIFLDQPVNVGFSYADDGTSVSTSPVAARDVYAFTQLFLSRFPQYSKLPFSIAAESYGGTFGPNVASVIHKENKALALASSSSLAHINLDSLILGNGLTDPKIQMASVPDYACNGPYPIYSDPNGPECQAIRTKVPTCERLIQSCYTFESRFTCVPALMYCNSQILGPLMQTGLNPYDVRKKCDRSKDGDLCYKQMTWIDKWMNRVETKQALGVDPTLTFASCNMEVNQAFALKGDGSHNSAALLPELINDGVRLLVYAGNADMMCNFIGNERWVEQLDTIFHDEFATALPTPWVTTESNRTAGVVRSAGGGGSTAGNITFAAVHEAGHMVPYDQPEASLDLITRWLTHTPLY